MPVVNKQSPSVKPAAKPAVNGPKLPGVLGNIKPMDEGLDDYLRVLIYGASGTGKTTLWATFPGRILVLLCSGGQRPGELRSVNSKEYRGKIDKVEVQSTAEAEEVLASPLIPGRYSTVVLDHASGLQDLILKEIMSWEDIPAQRPIIHDNKRTWGEVALQGKKLFRQFLNLNCHSVIVAQERTFGGDDNDKERGVEDVIKNTVGPALTPALAGWLAAACDYTVQTFKAPKLIRTVMKVGEEEVPMVERGKGVTYCLRTGPHDVYATKFRVDYRQIEVPDTVENPSYEKIAKILRGGGEKS